MRFEFEYRRGDWFVILLAAILVFALAVVIIYAPY